MDITPQLFTANVMHKRLFPKVNQFSYRVYYLALPLIQLGDAGKKIGALPIDRFSTLSFFNKDHGAKDGSNLEDWARATIAKYELNDITDSIMLICMPRILGYVFNPISFWMCLDKEKQLRAVICEVNNTFGETHNYVCMHEDRRIIDGDDWLVADKIFHVSPFLPREGSYHFRFSLNGEKLGMWIDYYANNGEKQLITALTGALTPIRKSSLRKVFWAHPLVTIKTIALIHWQALKLFSKRIKYITKPEQRKERLSRATPPNED